MTNKLGVDTRVSLLVLGPAGTGGTTVCGSSAQIGKTLVLAPKAREVDSWGYSRWGDRHVDDAGRVCYGDKIVTEVYQDTHWIPTLHKAEVTALTAKRVSEAQARKEAAKQYLKAEAYLKLLQRLYELYADTEFDNITVDPFTDGVNLLEHNILAPYGVGSPGEIEDTRGFYRELKDKADEFVFVCVGLKTASAVKPKNVLIRCHVQPPKEDQIGKGGEVKKSADRIARGIEYEGSVLPMLEGAYRRKMAGDFDLVVYTGLDQKYDAKKRESNPWYYIQVSPDRDRHSKIAVGITPQEDKLDNDFVALMEAISCQN